MLNYIETVQVVVALPVLVDNISPPSLSKHMRSRSYIIRSNRIRNHAHALCLQLQWVLLSTMAPVVQELHTAY